MATEVVRKYIQEFKDDQGKVIARCHYDRDKFPNGPILTENFDLPKKEKKTRVRVRVRVRVVFCPFIFLA